MPWAGWSCPYTHLTNNLIHAGTLQVISEASAWWARTISLIPEPDTSDQPSLGPHQSLSNPFQKSSPTSSQTLNLAEATTLLANNIKSPKKISSTKIQESNPFDGSDSCKLQPFFIQCTLNFWDHPDTFSSDSAKVTYALSYSKGTTLNWLEPGLLSNSTWDWLNDYDSLLRRSDPVSTLLHASPISPYLSSSLTYLSFFFIIAILSCLCHLPNAEDHSHIPCSTEIGKLIVPNDIYATVLADYHFSVSLENTEVSLYSLSFYHTLTIPNCHYSGS